MKYDYYNLNPYLNTTYQDFYNNLFHELGKNYTCLTFPSNCSMLCNKAIYMPIEFASILTTKSMQSSIGKIQTAHSYKLNNRMIDSRYEHMCFTYMLGVDFLIIAEQNGYKIDAQTKIAFLIKLLLHDIGHGPFSHPFEQMIDGYKGMHEDIGLRNIIENPEIRNKLEKIYPGLTDYVVNFNSQNTYGLHEIIEGIFDLDRAAFLIIDTWLSNESLYKENNAIELKKLITSIYNIFYSIILKEGHIYYDKKCLPDIETFIQKRTFNYVHLYQEVTRVLDDLILHEFGVELLKNTTNNHTLSSLTLPVVEFTNFLRLAKEQKAQLDLNAYYSYTDYDLERIAMLSRLYDNPSLSFYARLFISEAHYMKEPFTIYRFSDLTSYTEAKQQLPNSLSANNTIKQYKSTPDEHIIFYDKNTDIYTDFKDMEERTLDISPREEYFIFDYKQPESLPNVQSLRSYFQSYLIQNTEKVLKDCLNCLQEEKDNLNRQIILKIIAILKYTYPNKSFAEYAYKTNLSLNQLYSLLSLYTYDKIWSLYANYLTIDPKYLGIYFKEVSFATLEEQNEFITNLKSIISDNNTDEDIQNSNNDSIFKELCLITENAIFLSRPILNSIKLSESTKEKINRLLSNTKILVKKHK